MRTSLLILALLLAGALAGQSYRSRIHYKVKLGDEKQLHQLILLDYTKLLGTALDIKADSIYFRLRSADELSVIPLAEMRFLGEFVTGQSALSVPRVAPPLTDLTYERTALPFNGRGQLRIINLVYGVAELNLNQNVQVGLGVAGPLGLLTTQRLRFSLNPQLHLGISNQALFPPFNQGNGQGVFAIGDLTTMLTIGTERRFVNLGTGIFYNRDNNDGPVPLHRIGIGARVGERWHLYSEVLMSLDPGFSFPQLQIFPSFNASLGARRHRWQFGIFTVVLDEDSFFPPPLPYVGYAYYW